MEFISYFFSINNTFFEFIGYQMSYLEFFGTIFTIWCVWLTAKAKVLSWPVGIIGTVLYMFLFYQIQLYSDLFEQIYFLITGFVGWWAWIRISATKKYAPSTTLQITRTTKRENILIALAVVLGTAIFYYVAVSLDNWFPTYFPEPASFAALDAFTTSMSFVAQYLLIRKKVESWILWIVVDCIAIPLYLVKGIKFVSLEYLLFLGIAIHGLIAWRRTYRTSLQSYDNKPVSEKI